MRLVILALTICGAYGFGQTPPAAPAFEVAAVKVSKEPPGSDSSHSTTGSISMRNMTLRAITAEAYNILETKVAGGPKWLDDERFNIDAKAAGPVRGTELDLMLQRLLAERFQLAVHRESKTVPGYALMVTKGAFKMEPVEPGDSNMRSKNGAMTATKASMADLAETLSRRFGFAVADATGVAGVFDFKAQLPEPERRGARQETPNTSGEASDPASLAVALSRALEEQLGLRLQERKVPVERLVIDRAEKPVEN